MFKLTTGRKNLFYFVDVKALGYGAQRLILAAHEQSRVRDIVPVGSAAIIVGSMRVASDVAGGVGTAGVGLVAVFAAGI